MTTLPDPNEFVTIMGGKIANDIPRRPNVEEQHWGYEVRPAQISNRVNTIIRLSSYLVSLAFGIVGILALVWPMQDLGLSHKAQGFFAVGSLALAALAAHISSSHRSVRIQIDTTVGELREIIESPSRGGQVLARYGFDSIAAVEIVTSAKKSSSGQLQARVNGYGAVLVADGSISTLRSLGDRLAMDCGLDHTNARTAA